METLKAIIQNDQLQGIVQSFADQLKQINIATPSGGKQLTDLTLNARKIRQKDRGFNWLESAMSKLEITYTFNKRNYIEDRDKIVKRLKG